MRAESLFKTEPGRVKETDRHSKSRLEVVAGDLNGGDKEDDDDDGDDMGENVGLAITARPPRKRIPGERTPILECYWSL